MSRLRLFCGFAVVQSLVLGAFASIADAGLMESPINIATADAVYAPGLPSLLFNYATSANLILTDINATNTEGTVRAVVNTASSLGFNGRTFNLLQFHFHAGAEHAVNDHLAAMEMHFVHQSSSDGSFLVVSRLMEIGIGDNPLLAPIFSGMHLIPHSGDTLPLTGFDITALLPEDKSVYRYDGSFTTSPYTTGVLWNIFAAAPLLVSQNQLDTFLDLFPSGDARELQPLGSRMVYLVPEPSASIIAIIGLGVAGLSRRQKRQWLKKAA